MKLPDDGFRLFRVLFLLVTWINNELIMIGGGASLRSEGIRAAPVWTGDAADLTDIICPEFSLVRFFVLFG